MRRLLVVGSMGLLVAACAARGATDDMEGPDGAPGIVITGASGDGGAVGPGMLTVTIRDFKFYSPSDSMTNPDFENVVSPDPGIVDTALGADQKPVYQSAAPQTITTHGKKFFDEWYHDTPGANITVIHPLALAQHADGTLGYDSAVSGVPLNPNDMRRMWFPIDDGTQYATAFGNQGQLHNYSFTTELHTVFKYNGGESFSFSGDDDVFVFINRQLVIDLGGVHSAESKSVSLDSLGLTKGQTYPLDLFSAERHTIESNLSFTTSLNLQNPPQ